MIRSWDSHGSSMHALFTSVEQTMDATMTEAIVDPGRVRGRVRGRPSSAAGKPWCYLWSSLADHGPGHCRPHPNAGPAMVDQGRPWSATIDHGRERGRAFFAVLLATMVAWYLFTHGSSRDTKKNMHAAMTEAMHGHAYQ